MTLPLGGDAATAFFRRIEVTGTVRKVGGGVDRARRQPPARGRHGPRRSIFEVGPVTLLISELRGVAGNVPDVYRAFGIEPADYKMAVLKTASNFQYFAPITSRVIRVDTRGPGQSDVFTLPWTRIPRPIYPLDPIGDWRERSPAQPRRRDGKRARRVTATQINDSDRRYRHMQNPVFFAHRAAAGCSLLGRGGAHAAAGAWRSRSARAAASRVAILERHRPTSIRSSSRRSTSR